jgi:hypothetical protein
MTTGTITIGGTGAQTGTIALGTGTGAQTINLGTGGTGAKTVTIGSTASTGNTTIQSGTGNINLQSAGTGTTGNVQIGAGGAGSATPDLLVMDIKNTAGDPTGTNGAMYYNSNTNKFRCFENAAWKDCTTTPGGPSASSVTDTSVTSPTPGTNPTLGTEVELMNPTNPSIAPDTTSTRIYITGSVLYSNPTGGDDTDTTIVVRIRRGSGSCAGTQVGPDLTTTITDPLQTHWVTWSLVDSPATTSSQAYTVCAATRDGNGATTPNATTPTVMMTIQEIAAAGADLAEAYSTNDNSINAGDVVALDPTLKAGVMKTDKAYDNQVFGIISTAPGMILGDSNSTGEGIKEVPVALSGRVPVKVNNEEGSIKAGDPLTTSSTPGVAMKAVRAGVIIGMAMSDYNGTGEGQVMAFIKNGFGHGDVASILPGATDSGSPDYSRLVLNALVTPQNVSSIPADLSQLLTDRLVAGVEIITPKLTAKDAILNGTLSLVDADGNEKVRIDSLGNATFAGTVKADSIEARQIKGLSLLINSEIASASATPISSVSATPTPDLSVADLVNGFFRKAAEFFGQVIFHSDVAFLGRPTFNKDTAGFVALTTGQDEADITFDKEYVNQPVVTASVNLTGGANISDVPGYAVYDVTTKGFKIKLSKVAANDLQFSWIAVAVKDAVITKGQVSGASTAPTATPVPAEPTSTASPTFTPPATSPTAVPIPTDTPTPVASPTP